MTFLPIVDREFRVAARKPFTYYSRCAAAAVAAAVSYNLVFADMKGVISAGTSGQTVFYIMSAFAYAFVCLAGALQMSDCLSREKREGTLGLLFLTDLKAYDIAIGKLVSHSHRNLCYVLAIIPPSSLVLVLGGVSGVDFLAMAIAILNALFFSGAISILVSTCLWRDFRAIGAGVGLVILFAILIPGFGFAIATSPASVNCAFLLFGPAGAFVVGLGTGVTGLPFWVFWASILTSQIIAWTCLAVACYLLPRSIQKSPTIAKPEPQSSTDKTALLTPLRPELPSFLRVIGRTPAGWLQSIAAPVLASIGLAIYAAVNPIRWAEPVWLGTVVVVLHLWLKYLVAERACRALDQNRESGELELLLTTPFNEDEILRGYMLGLKREVFRPILCVLLADLAIVIAGCLKSKTDWYLLALAYFGELLWLIVNLYALAWVGLYLGMRAKSTGAAIQRTISSVVVAPWAGMMLILALAALASGGQGLSANLTAGMLFAGMPFAILLCSIGFTAWAMNELRDRFRDLASQQTLPKSLRPKRSWHRWWRQFFLLDPA